MLLMGVYDDDEINNEQQENSVASEPYSISIWIAIIAVAAAIKIFANSSFGAPFYSTALNQISSFIIFLPGALILPLIFGAWMGLAIGSKSKSISQALKASSINAIYSAVKYGIAIAVIYELMFYLSPISAPPQEFLIYNWLAAPIGIVIASCIFCSAISYARNAAS